MRSKSKEREEMANGGNSAEKMNFTEQIGYFYGGWNEEAHTVAGFLQRLDNARILNHWNDEVTIVAFKQHLRDGGANWWYMFSENHPNKAKVWSDVKTAFSEYFTPKKRAADV